MSERQRGSVDNRLWFTASFEARCFSRSVFRHSRLDLACPGIDAAGDVGHIIKSLCSQKLRHSHAASTVMAEDEQVFVFRKSGDVLRNLAHRDVTGARDCAGLHLRGLSHVDHLDVARLLIKQPFCFGCRNFHRVDV